MDMKYVIVSKLANEDAILDSIKDDVIDLFGNSKIIIFKCNGNIFILTIVSTELFQLNVHSSKVHETLREISRRQPQAIARVIGNVDNDLDLGNLSGKRYLMLTSGNACVKSFIDGNKTYLYEKDKGYIFSTLFIC